MAQLAVVRVLDNPEVTTGAGGTELFHLQLQVRRDDGPLVAEFLVANQQVCEPINARLMAAR